MVYLHGINIYIKCKTNNFLNRNFKTMFFMGYSSIVYRAMGLYPRLRCLVMKVRGLLSFFWDLIVCYFVWPLSATGSTAVLQR